MDAAVQGAAGRPWFTRVGRRSGVGRGGGVTMVSKSRESYARLPR